LGMVKEKGDKGYRSKGEKGMRWGREGSGPPIAPLAQGPALGPALATALTQFVRQHEQKSQLQKSHRLMLVECNSR